MSNNDAVMQFRMVEEELANLFEEKNRRYGNSFAEQFKKRGLVMSAIRLEDKFRRFDELVSNPCDDGGDESIEDTLKDLANYAIMTIMAIREQRGEGNASTKAKLPTP